MDETPFNPISSINEDRIRYLEHYGPVTCLKIWENYILAGYGPNLKIFAVDKTSNASKLILNKQLFKRNKIHNISISVSGDKLVAVGARSFTVLDLKALLTSQQLIEVEEKSVNEWIISSAFLDENTLLLLNSHNTIYKIDINSFTFSDKIHCNEKSILYSGSIRVLSDGTVIVAAGTVMNGVIAWDLHQRAIIHNLKEHEGSIFGVKIDQTGKYLISCSDDRSLKIYDFKTGNLLASGWGHASRIWNLEFFQDTSDGIKLMTTGEDCTIRFWRYEEGNDTLIQTELLENAHLGKHIWSADLDDVNLKLSVSGGADGRVRLYDLENRGITKNFPAEILQEQTGFTFVKNEYMKQFAELPRLGLFLIITSHGNMLCYDENQNKFFQIDLDDSEKTRFFNFSIMKSFKNINTVVACTRTGDLLVLEFVEGVKQPTKTWLQDKHLNGSKVTNMLVESNDNEYYVLFDSPNPKEPFVLHVFAYQDKFEHQKTIKLVQPNQVFTTTTMLLDPVNNWLILGSRYVNIALYDLNSKADTIELNNIYKKLSSGDAITCLSMIEAKENKTTLLVTVRDGVYMYLEISKSSTGTLEIEIHHQNKLTRGFIEGGYIHDTDLILYGFKSSYFYIWNETKQLELTTELCGGAHRLWELFRYDNFTDYKFAYINKSTLHIKKFTGRFVNQNYGLLNLGCHGREIRDVTISPSSTDNFKYIMTASEDATVKLGKIDETGSIHNFWSMNNHVSGLQRIKFFDDTYIGSSAANEEFFIWKLNSDNPQTPALTEFARLNPSSDIPDLRIMDFDVLKCEDGFLITTVYSNSSIKLWRFNIETKQFALICSEYHATCCILNVQFLSMNLQTYLMISATDGNIAIWNISECVKHPHTQQKLGNMIIKQQLHQNGVKAILAVKELDNYDIITGGDDNALILSKLFVQDNELALIPQSFVESAASSTITSISKLPGKAVAVTSVDQILRKWTYDGETLECDSAKYTTIADTGCSDSTVLNGNSIVLVGGAGLSSFTM
jgi:WD40 repeat protein